MVGGWWLVVVFLLGGGILELQRYLFASKHHGQKGFFESSRAIWVTLQLGEAAR